MAVKIITDSTSYLPESQIKKYNIIISSLSVVFENESIKEIDIDNSSFYEKLKNSTTIPKSSQPSISELYDIFEKEVKAKNDIVGIFISSEMSGTYSSACMVKNMILEEYPEATIEIIDSRSNCMQLGYTVISAAKAAQEGKSISEVVCIAQKTIRSSKFLFIPNTLEYLKMGGRIGNASALIGSLLKIKPILTVSKGKTDIVTKVRTKKKALQTIIDIFIKDGKEYGLEKVIVHHINDRECAMEFADQIKKIIGKQVQISNIGPVIGAHVGPGALGIVYCTNNEMV